MAMTEKVLETMYNKLDKFLKTETVIGEPMDLGEIKLIPIVTASFGMGGGLGEENKEGSKSEGGGGGLGCRISPDAILVIKGDEVELIKLQGKRSLDKLFEMMPELIEKVEAFKSSKNTDNQPEDEVDDE